MKEQTVYIKSEEQLNIKARCGSNPITVKEIQGIVLTKDEYADLTESKQIIGHNLLADLLNEQKSVLCSPLRFDGVDIRVIERIFKKYGIEIPQLF